MRDVLFLVGRILFSLILVGGGIGQLIDERSAEYAERKGVPSPKLLTQVSGVALLLGGVAIILGVYMDLAALGVAVLVLIIAVLMHPFWNETDANVRQTEMSMFMKNLSIAGGALLIVAVTSDGSPYTLTNAVF